MSPIITVYDLGTNTFRWLSAQVTNTGYEVLCRGREPVGMGRSLASDGQFLQPEITTATRLLERWRPGRGIVPDSDVVIATATHAFRAAHNGEQIAARLTEQTGIPIRIVTTEHEAALTFAGVTEQHDGTAEESPVAVLDIGGGSTELALGTSGQLQQSLSLPVGVVTLAADEATTLTAAIAATHTAVDAAWHGVYNETPFEMLRPRSNTTLLSTCGTSSALTTDFVGISDYNRDELDGIRVPGDWLSALIEARANWLPSNWRTHAAAGDKRAHLMGPGIGILSWFLQALGADGWSNREAGLLEGALLEQLAEFNAGQQETGSTHA